MARESVLNWLSQRPRSTRDEPPDTDYELKKRKWIERGAALPSVGDVLCDMLMDASKPRQRRAVASVIGQLAGNKSLRALKKVFETDDVPLHLEALTSLRAIESKYRFDVLEVALSSTYRPIGRPDPGVPSGTALVRAKIAVLLSETDDERGKQLLGVLSFGEADPFVLEVLQDIRGEYDNKQ